MTFNHDSQFIMNKITFNELGNVIANYDMNGYRIVTAALPWKPSLAIEDCDKNGRNRHRKAGGWLGFKVSLP